MINNYPSTNNTAVMYGRVSSDEQKEKYSLPAQSEQGEKYALEHGLKIVKEYSVSESAKEPGRKNFNEMITYAKKHKIGHILFKKADRSSRNETDAATIIRLARSTDISFHFIEEGMVLNRYSKNHEFSIYMINCVMAALMPRDLSVNVQTAFVKKAKMGYYPMRPPYGYKSDKKKSGETSHIIIDPDKAPYVLRIFKLYATGNYTYKSLAEQMTSEGMQISNSVKCNKRNIELILNNRTYMGEFEFKGITYEGKHEPIVTRELFHHVQNVIKGNTTNIGAGKRNLLFSGFFKCAHCGCALTGEKHKEKYVYYHCTGNKGGECKHKYISESKLEKGLLTILEKIKPTPEIIKIALKAIKSEFKYNLEYNEHQARSIEKQILTLQKRLSNLLDLYTDGNIDKKDYDAKNKQWRSELDGLLITQTNINKIPLSYIDRARDVFELCKNAKEWYLQGDYEKKRELIRLLCLNFLYNGSKPLYKLNPVFQCILELSKNKKNGGNGN